jgi:hypothetical protein
VPQVVAEGLSLSQHVGVAHVGRGHKRAVTAKAQPRAVLQQQQQQQQQEEVVL